MFTAGLRNLKGKGKPKGTTEIDVVFAVRFHTHAHRMSGRLHRKAGVGASSAACCSPSGRPQGLLGGGAGAPLIQHALSAEDSPLAPGNKVAFSSYPGTIFSCDDFYVLGTGLVSPPPVSPFFLPGLLLPSSSGWAGGHSCHHHPRDKAHSPVLVLGCWRGLCVCMGVCVGGVLLNADSQACKTRSQPGALRCDRAPQKSLVSGPLTSAASFCSYTFRISRPSPTRLCPKIRPSLAFHKTPLIWPGLLNKCL